MLCKLKGEETKMAQRSTYNCILTSEKREYVSAYTIKCLNDTTKIKNCVRSTLFEKKLHKWRVIMNNIIGRTGNLVYIFILIFQRSWLFKIRIIES